MQIGAVPGTIREFHVNTTESILPTSVYSWGLGFGVLLGTAASELFGRQVIYRVSLPLTLVFTVVAATGKSYTAFCVGKALAGVAAGPCLAIGVGVSFSPWRRILEQILTCIFEL
jgi:predicted MFS family arabinose efflux permease